MRAIVAAVLLCGLGTGCCKTCGWCHDEATSRTNAASPAVAAPAVAAPAASTQPPAPAGVPVGRPAGVGAYGGTGN
jgi:hypothetical protein